MWWTIASCHQSAVCRIRGVMADWKHNQVTTHWYSHCFQSRPTIESPWPCEYLLMRWRIGSTTMSPNIDNCSASNLALRSNHLGRVKDQRCDGGSYCAINPPCEYLLLWWRIGSTTRSLRIDFHSASNLALRPNHFVQKQISPYAQITSANGQFPYTQITMSKNNKYFRCRSILKRKIH